jgi:elongation factor G
MGAHNDKNGTSEGRVLKGPRCIALVGPFQSGKTALFEALLERCGSLERGGRGPGHLIADQSAEARGHSMSTDINVASASFMGERFTFIDCPGSIEFLHQMRHVLPVVDAAIVVCEADDRKAPALELIMRELEDADIPRFLFLNKVDTATRRVRETLAALQPASRTPLLLRQIPIWKGGIAVGFIDLALERAFIYREHAPSEVVELPEAEMPREKDARFSMLERLADYDDELMESLIGDMEPPKDRIFDDLSRELRERHVVPVLIGCATRGNGVTRLLKALRHEAPGLAETCARLGVPDSGPPLAQVIHTQNSAHGGKLSLARILRGKFAEGDLCLTSQGKEGRIAGLLDIQGAATNRKSAAETGETVAFARVDALLTGDCLTSGKSRPQPVLSIAPPEPVHALTLHVRDRKDDVRLMGALAKLTEEDTSLLLAHNQEHGELTLSGQGEMHLRVALERLADRFGVHVTTSAPAIGYRETIRARAGARGRHRKQSGGHGQYGDCVLEIAPLPPGSGVVFVDRIAGGVVPRQYIPSVEAGVHEAAKRGPLGFPVVDIEVTLTDGSYHTVDSSDMAFRQAARIAMAEALAAARPVLLEPVMSVLVAVPREAMSRASAILSSRRGQIIGLDSRPGWEGWDIVEAHLPEAELGGLIVELRSATAGVGSFTARFDHLAELGGKAAEIVTAQHAKDVAAAH